MHFCPSLICEHSSTEVQCRIAPVLMRLYFKYESPGKMSQKISQLRRRVLRKTSGQRATKLLLLRPCKTLVVDGLRECDPVARTHFCNWFRQSVYDGV
jgi:hypothetical protein